MVHAPQAGLGPQRTDGRQRHHLGQPLAEFFLSAAGHQKVPEGTEAAALVGVADGIARAHDFIEQGALGAFPQRDLLAHPPIQQAEVVLHLAKVGQQLARDLLELLEAVLDGRVVEQGHLARQRTLDLGVQFVALAAQLVHPLERIDLGAGADLFEQRKQRHQPRFGADEGALGQRLKPGQRLLGGRRQVELRLVRARLVELAQPTLVGRGPIVQVVQRRFGVSLGAQLLAQREQLVLQQLRQIGFAHHPHIRHNEHAVQEAGHQRGVGRSEQAPRGMALTQRDQQRVIKHHGQRQRGLQAGAAPAAWGQGRAAAPQGEWSSQGCRRQVVQQASPLVADRRQRSLIAPHRTPGRPYDPRCAEKTPDRCRSGFLW